MERFKFVEQLSGLIETKHKILDKFPEPWRSRAIIFGYKLGLVGAIGYVKLQPCDSRGVPNKPAILNANIVTDVGATRIRDILAGTSTELPSHMEFGSGRTTPTAGDTDLTIPLGANARLAATKTTPGAYEIRFQVFINGTYGPRRPYTVSEQAIFTHLTAGVCVAHALIMPPHTISGTNTATVTYGLLIR